MIGLEFKVSALLVENECGAQCLESLDMGIHTAAANLVTSGLAHCSVSQTGQQRSKKHDRSAQSGAFGHKVHALGITAVNVIGLECPASGSGVLHLDAQICKHVYQVPDIKDIRYVLYRHLIK